MLKILSLCDYSGSWSAPHERAGYEVKRIDLQKGQVLCVNCTYHSDATITSGQCDKHSKVIVQNNQVCDYFIERGKEHDQR